MVSHIVQKLISENKYIQEALAHDIINEAKLARYLKPDIEKELNHEVTEKSIVMGIRKYKEKFEKKFNIHENNYFRNKLVKDNICLVYLKEAPTILQKLSTFYRKIDFKTGGILNISSGNYEVGIITNERYKEDLLELLKFDNNPKVIENLVSISLIYNKNFLFTPGVLYNIFRFLAWDNINILGLIITPGEQSIIVSEKDSSKCQEILNKLVKDKKDSSTK